MINIIWIIIILLDHKSFIDLLLFLWSRYSFVSCICHIVLSEFQCFVIFNLMWKQWVLVLHTFGLSLSRQELVLLSCCLTCDGEVGNCSDVLAGASDIELVLAFIYFPMMLINIPDRNISGCQMELSCLFLIGFKCELIESFELFDRLKTILWEPKIQLNNFFALHFTSVFNF